jgi:hypothetical protein
VLPISPFQVAREAEIGLTTLLGSPREVYEINVSLRIRTRKPFVDMATRGNRFSDEPALMDP